MQVAAFFEYHGDKEEFVVDEDTDEPEPETEPTPEKAKKATRATG